MPKKKDFWDLADSTILSRTKKKELLQIGRNEHKQVVLLQAQLEAQSLQVEEQAKLVNEISQLQNQLDKEGAVHQKVLEDLLDTFNQQQHNHEQELSRIQTEARNWEKVAQDYEDVIATQDSELSSLRYYAQKLMAFGKMSPLEAGRAFVEWLFNSSVDQPIDTCHSCGGEIHSEQYKFCPHCGAIRKATMP